jgi:hypothetical protein
MQKDKKIKFIENCCMFCKKNETCTNEHMYCGKVQQKDCQEAMFPVACAPCEEFEEIK